MLTLCTDYSPFCPLQTTCCSLFLGPKVLTPFRLFSPPVRGLPRMWKHFLPHSSLPGSQVLFLSLSLSLSFSIFPLFYLLSYLSLWGFSCLFGSLISPVSIQKMSHVNFSTCKCIFNFSLEEVSSMSYFSTLVE